MRRKLTALIALTTTACTTWHVEPGPVPAEGKVVGKAGPNERVRLEMKSGALVDVFEASVVGDSVVGMSGPATQAARTRLAVATADVRRVTIKKVSPGRTVLAVVAITAATLVMVGAASSSSGSTSNSSCSSAATPG